MKKNIKNKKGKFSLEKTACLIFSVFILCFAIVSLTLAADSYTWQPPTFAPLDGNAPPPINVGNVGQIKYGAGLTLNVPDSDGNYMATGLLVPYGNVGIGTTNPTSLFTVSKTFTNLNTTSTGADFIYNWTPTANDSTYASMAFRAVGKKYGNYSVTGSMAVRGFQSQVLNYGTGAVGSMAAGTFYINNSNTGVVTQGNGIYIFSPAASTANPITTAIGLNISAQKTTGVTNGYGIYQTGASDSNYFAGSVGIGITNPTAALNIVGSGDPKATLLIQETSGLGSPSINLKASDGSYQSLYIYSGAAFNNYKTPNGVQFYDANANLTRLTIASSGNIGIGTVNPGAKLDVQGTLRIPTGTPPTAANMCLLSADTLGTAKWGVCTGGTSSGFTSILGKGGNTYTSAAASGILKLWPGDTAATGNNASGIIISVDTTNDVVNFYHANTSSIGAGFHSGGANTVITGITTDNFGHVTGVTYSTASATSSCK